MDKLEWSETTRQLWRNHHLFDPQHLTWAESTAQKPADCLALAPDAALRALAKHRLLRRLPIGIIGPREATKEECALAYQLGRAYAEHGLQLICGGKNGVMEAACKGHHEAGGLPIGILPDEEWQAANSYVAIPIATGIGPARNAIIARAASAMVAIGGGVGTLSEMALGLQFKRLVLAMASAPVVAGVKRLDTVDDVMKQIATYLFGL